MLTVLLSSPRVAPGLLTWQAWSALRAASRVLAGSAGHPQLPALTAAGVIPEIVELPADESAAILDFLYRHCANPNFHVRFRWRPHSVAFWDNRCTQHLAVWDYFPMTRSGFRVTVAGDAPF